MKMLVAAIRARGRPGDAEEVWASSLASRGAMIFRGAIGPKGAYRLRGYPKAVVARFRALGRSLESELEYPNFGAARAALIAAALAGLLTSMA